MRPQKKERIKKTKEEREKDSKATESKRAIFLHNIPVSSQLSSSLVLYSIHEFSRRHHQKITLHRNFHYFFHTSQCHTDPAKVLD